MGILSLSLLMLGFPALPPASAAPITLTEVATGFNNPIGIDHHEPTNRLIISVNYPTGTPSNFALVAPDGTQSPFSAISGLTDELKLATVRSGPCQGGFTPGEMFTGSGAPGVVVRVTPDGSSIQNPWVQLPGETGLLRGSLFQDRYCAFGGDLIVVTTSGGVWRINSAGAPTELAQVSTHLEGVTTLPNDQARYGPWAGKIVAGAEGQTRFYTIDTAGTVVPYDLGISPEDIDLINPNENFYGVDFANKKILTADKTQWTSMVGDLAVAQEGPGILWRVHWDPAAGAFTTEQLATVGQWEHVTFSPASIVTVGIGLDPPTGTNIVGQPHTVTATVADSEGGLQSGVPVAFTVSGANAGAIGTCSPPSCATGPDGKVTFTYTGAVAGNDTITACFTNRNGDQVCSTATKTWFYQTVSINDVTVVEGDPPTLTPATFTVTLSSPAGPNGVTVNATTASAAPASPLATADVDYDSQTNTPITFAPGEQSKPFTVQVKGDLIDEPDEQYLVNLSQPVNATIDDGQAVGTILDDERNGKLSCRATGVRLIALELGVANGPDAPCKDDSKTLVRADLNTGVVALQSGTVQVSTDQNPDELEPTSPAVGDQGVAAARIEGLKIKVGLTEITAEVLSATATAECGAPIGTLPGLTGSSLVTNVKINGNPVANASDPVNITIPLVGVLHLNHQSGSAGVLTQRALWLEGTGPLSAVQVVVAEAKADFSGNPCDE